MKRSNIHRLARIPIIPIKDVHTILQRPAPTFLRHHPGNTVRKATNSKIPIPALILRRIEAVPRAGEGLLSARARNLLVGSNGLVLRKGLDRGPQLGQAAHHGFWRDVQIVAGVAEVVSHATLGVGEAKLSRCDGDGVEFRFGKAVADAWILRGVGTDAVAVGGFGRVSGYRGNGEGARKRVRTCERGEESDGGEKDSETVHRVHIELGSQKLLQRSTRLISDRQELVIDKIRIPKVARQLISVAHMGRDEFEAFNTHDIRVALRTQGVLGDYAFVLLLDQQCGPYDPARRLAGEKCHA